MEQINIEIIVNLSYILASMLFIFGLKMLGSPETARRGNLISSSGMLLAVIVSPVREALTSDTELIVKSNVTTESQPAALVKV